MISFNLPYLKKKRKDIKKKKDFCFSIFFIPDEISLGIRNTWVVEWNFNITFSYFSKNNLFHPSKKKKGRWKAGERVFQDYCLPFLISYILFFGRLEDVTRRFFTSSFNISCFDDSEGLRLFISFKKDLKKYILFFCENENQSNH